MNFKLKKYKNTIKSKQHGLAQCFILNGVSLQLFLSKVKRQITVPLKVNLKAAGVIAETSARVAAEKARVVRARARGKRKERKKVKKNRDI